MSLAETEKILAKDPVCGMSVDPATAEHRFEHGGQTYFFCCGGCRTKFAADPARYLAASPRRTPVMAITQDPRPRPSARR